MGLIKTENLTTNNNSKSSNVLMGRYEVGKLLGQGTFAKVYLARNIHTGTNFAIKVVNKAKIIKAGLMDQIKREISVMRLVRHPNIVELYEVMATRCRIYFVMEYVNGGELFTKIAKQGKLTEDEARKYFQQLISAVDYCHSRGVYHRDLKPENLLLSEGGDLKVSDFGLSALGESRRADGLLHTTCGTPAYVAPEVISRMGYDGAKADIWSCGVVLFVLVAGYLPFRDSNLMEMYRKIGKAEFKFPGWCSKEVRRLLSRILDPNPETRATVGKIRKSTWFKQGECGDLKVVKGSGRKNDDRKAVEESHKKLDEELLLIDSPPTDPGPDPAAEFMLCSKPNPMVSGFSTKSCYYMNAFDIISLSEGFDLSGLFEEKKQRKEVRFSAWESASTIITKLEDVAKRLKIKVKKKECGRIKFEGKKVGRKGVLAFEAEIFEVTPMFHMVEMKKSSGDTLEYEKVVKEDIRPALKDIIWTWKGDQEQQEQTRTGQEEELCDDVALP